MNKCIVIFKSTYGSTEKYAHWIADSLSCDISEEKDFKVKDFADYGTIIYGGGLYAGGVNGFNLITKNFQKIKDKNIILFTCGLADTADEKNINNIKKSLNKVLSTEMQDKIKVFHLRGAMDYSQLGLIHKSMMAMLRKSVSRKDASALTDEDKLMLETYGQSIDFIDKTSINPIIDYVHNL